MLLVLLLFHGPLSSRGPGSVVCVPSQGDRKAVVVVCPLDAHSFPAFEPARLYGWGGTDADGCRHELGSNPLADHVWVCPSCGFAGRKKDFDKSSPLDDDTKKTLRDTLKPATPLRKGMKQDEIPLGTKYDLLAQVEECRGAPALDIGRTLLTASWAVRQMGAPDLPDFDEWTTLLDRYGIRKSPLDLGKKNRSDHELEQAAKLAKDLTDGKFKEGNDRLLALYLVASLQRRHGENTEARKWLPELEKLQGQNSVVDDAVKVLSASLPIEADFQRRALPRLEKAFEEASGLQRQSEILYQRGELHRRLGEFQKAVECYDRVSPLATGDLRKLAERQRKLLP